MLRHDWPCDDEEGEHSRQKEWQGLGTLQVQEDDRMAAAE